MIVAATIIINFVTMHAHRVCSNRTQAKKQTLREYLVKVVTRSINEKSQNANFLALIGSCVPLE